MIDGIIRVVVKIRREDKLELEKQRSSAKNNAYALLRQRPRSVYEIRNRLKLKGYGDDLIEDIIANLKRSGELDDEKFARFWVESRMHMNPSGDVLLRYELKTKGISDGVIEATLSEKAGKYDEYELAFSMAKERFERLKKLDRQKAMKRVYDFLLRRGFAYDTVRKIIEKITKSHNSPS
ncbi:MAG: regulatory protein RecX [Candidatus Omnitrophota bacterium]|nr:regulatory protein RecX [Candidatus Omnitrophota bacterium]